MKLTPAQIKILNSSKDKIAKLTEKQDAIYENVKSQLNTEDKGDYLLDYLFNSFDDVEKLEEYLNE